jgi:extracellular elastinolytic metalloproteinase
VVPGQADPNNLDNVALFTARTYEFVAHAPGYGHLRFRARLRPGETRTIDLYFATNWASQFKGAVAGGDGIRHSSLIDDTEVSNWESNGVPVEGRQVTVALGGGAHKLDRAAVSAYLQVAVGDNEVATATQNRFTALRQFELRTCTAAASPSNPTCLGTNAAGWRVIYRSARDFFPGDTPRPVAPELLLRGFGLGGGDDDDDDDDDGRRGSSQRATHVQFVVLSNQCTGNPAFQDPGDPAQTDQDNDPANETDCRLGSPTAGLVGRANDVRAAELQLYSSEHRVRGAELAREGGGDDDGDDD